MTQQNQQNQPSDSKHDADNKGGKNPSQKTGKTSTDGGKSSGGNNPGKGGKDSMR